MIRAVAQLVWQFEGRLAIAVHSAQDPSNLEWSGYLRDTLAQADVSSLRVLVISYGGGPSGAQRRQLMESLRRPAPTALLSSSRFARTVVGVLSWFNPKIRAFGLYDDAAAYKFLELTQDEQELARKLRTRLESQLPSVPRSEAAP
jgi:hypothetical protein